MKINPHINWTQKTAALAHATVSELEHLAMRQRMCSSRSSLARLVGVQDENDGKVD